jgi:hypothetical protein
VIKTITLECPGFLAMEKWPLSILIGSLGSNSEAIVTAQTARSLSKKWLKI